MKILGKFFLWGTALFLLSGIFPGPVLGATTSSGAAGQSSGTQARKDQPQSNVKMIWEYKAELGLTDTQVTDIKQAIEDFQKSAIEGRSKIEVAQLDLRDLIQKKADLTAIKAKLSDIAALQVDYQFADIQTARKIDGILTPEQIQKWRDIQKVEAVRQAPPAPTVRKPASK